MCNLLERHNPFDIFPTRCNITHFIYFCKTAVHVWVVSPPIIRSTHNCIYSIWYFSNRYCYLPLLWKRWNWFQCGVGILLVCFGAIPSPDACTLQLVTTSSIINISTHVIRVVLIFFVAVSTLILPRVGLSGRLWCLLQKFCVCRCVRTVCVLIVWKYLLSFSSAARQCVMQYSTTCNPCFVVSEPNVEEYGCPLHTNP